MCSRARDLAANLPCPNNHFARRLPDAPKSQARFCSLAYATAGGAARKAEPPAAFRRQGLAVLGWWVRQGLNL